jgi:sensor domain CHASE-containing protein
MGWGSADTADLRFWGVVINTVEVDNLANPVLKQSVFHQNQENAKINCQINLHLPSIYYTKA